MNNIHSFAAGHILLPLRNSDKLLTAFFHKLVQIFPYFICLVVISLALITLRILWNRRQNLKQTYVFLELTPPALTEKTSYTTQQLFSVLYSIGYQRTFLDKIKGHKIYFSLEIVSTKEQGIRYLIRTTENEANIIRHSILSYLPFVRVTKTKDYLQNLQPSFYKKIDSFKLTKHFAFPLVKQNILNQHDPVAYITGMMTKMKKDELIALQIVLTPAKTKSTKIVTEKILRGDNVLAFLQRPQFPGYIKPVFLIFTVLFKILLFIAEEGVAIIHDFVHTSSVTKKYTTFPNTYQQQLQGSSARSDRVLNAFEKEIITSVQEKIEQELFETSLRVLYILQDKNELQQRIRGIRSAFAPFSVPGYQSLHAESAFPPFLIHPIRFFTFRHRLLSAFTNTGSALLSLAEIADLYHFPYSQTTKTENIIKIHAREFPAPVSLKQDSGQDVVFGKNTYGNEQTDIGLTDIERAKHVFLLGQTGSGKTTIIFHMAKQDMEKGRGVAIVDPHGDLAKELIYSVPKKRIADVIYFNPFDIANPIGINLLELPPGLTEDELELEKELVCESVISIFRRVFSNEENNNAHRIEYILRNTIHTAFTVKKRTIFTVYQLLTDPQYRKNITSELENEDLKNFWKNEFGIGGDYQILKMIQGVTAKVGRFLFSPTAKRVLEQEKSTIDFDTILNRGKILICNLSEGKIGEDTSRLFGTMIIMKIQQAAVRRERMEFKNRKPFYLFVDEFQNFATGSFTRMLSGGRKFGLRITIAEQSISQQEERRIANIILANTGTVICFRTASPIDEELMLVQFAPYIDRTDIVNLPNYIFYIKISATKPEEPFSGETIPITIKKSHNKFETIVTASRNNYAIVYKKPIKESVTTPKKEPTDAQNSDISTL